MPKTLSDYMQAYQAQMSKRDVPLAYRGLMQYLMGLRVYFDNRYPEYTVSGSLYFGYMDMSYFSITAPSLKSRGLKVAVVFLHDTCSFEIWLSGINRGVQRRYYDLFSAHHWPHGTVCTPGKGVDAVVSAPLVKTPNFDNLDALTAVLDARVHDFIDAVETFLNPID